MRRREIINLGCSDSEEEQPPPSRGRRGRPTRASTRKKGAKQNQVQNDSIIILDGSNIEEQIPKKKTKTIVLEEGLEISIDDISDEEMEQCIRVIWGENAEVHRFDLKPSNTLQSVYEHLSEKYNVPIEKIKIRNGDNVLSIFNTVESLKLQVTQALEAYPVQENSDSCLKECTGKIRVKCLLQTSKKPLVFYLYQNQDFSSIVNECAKELKCSVEKIKLKFDGDVIQSSETPISLDLEGDECFEAHTL